MATEIKKYLDNLLNHPIPGFDCIIYKNGEEVFRHFGGYSDLENKIPMNGKERYYIYSASKPITCTAALQLYEKGLYKLDDDLGEYMSEFKDLYIKTENGLKKAENRIKIRDLFTMSAGFSYDLSTPNFMQLKKDTNGRCPTREAMKYLAKDNLLFEPSERWEYSLCHDVLGAFIEVISGEKFNDYLTKNIFTPLGMSNTTFLLKDGEEKTIIPIYRLDNETREMVNCTHQPHDYIIGSEYASGGAGGVSTVEDYIKYLEAMRKGDVILKKETIDMMCVNQFTDEQLKRYWHPEYGYGLGVRCTKGNDDITDFGWGGAAGAYLVIDRVNNITLYYAQHQLTSGTPTKEIYDLAKYAKF